MKSLTLAAQEELEQNSHTKKCNIQVRAIADNDEKIILLTGCVKSFYKKQCAQEAIRKLFPEVRIRNDIFVLYKGEEGSYDSGGVSDHLESLR